MIIRKIIKKNIHLAFILLFYISCSTPIIYPTKDELKRNYQLIDRIVQNPDSIDIFIDEYNLSRRNLKKSEYFRLYNMVKRKIKANDFKSGYTITDDQIIYDKYNYNYHNQISFIHSMFIQSNKTGKRIFFQFDNNNFAVWRLYDIHTIILSQDSILEY